jgi:polar amino acid transport system ATP-binding protein
MLIIEKLSKSFQGLPVLKDLSLQITTQSIVGLAGPSGSGKSTLLRCIQHLETFDSGTITCDGKTGFMFQDFQLFPHMNVLQNLLYAPALRDSTDGLKHQAQKLLETLGLADKALAYPHALSGGQKQRVALARCLMMQPQLLLCDEPTSGLDHATRLDVVALLHSIREQGITMLIASHDMDFLSKIADRVVHIKNGEIIAPDRFTLNLENQFTQRNSVKQNTWSPLYL